MSQNSLNEALHYFEKNESKFLDQLIELVKIPSVSFEGFPKDEVVNSASAVSELLKETGLENIEILEVPGAHPYVYADKITSPDKPTLLLYAHHDVQPPGRSEIWKTNPFIPEILDGPNGKRLYGRGAADDKAGVLVHTSSIESYLKTSGELPVNVKVLIEGEEETGSEHLLEFLNKYKSKLMADILVLTDTMNFDSGIPSLTVSLRGMVAVEVEVRGLTKTVHSGMWGGPVADPVLGLTKALSSLVDDRGQIAIPEIISATPKWDEEKKKNAHTLPYNEKQFRKQSGAIDSAEIISPENSPYAEIWWKPSLAINAIQASSRAQAGNVINDMAWAKVGMRLAPGMDPDHAIFALENAIKRNVPWGLDVQFKREVAAGGWETQAWNDGKVGKLAFDSAEVALKKGYGKDVVKIGCGGSIPFVEPFAIALGGAPALLVGVEDPYTDAHGENESLLISDFHKACKGQVYLFQEIADRWRQLESS